MFRFLLFALALPLAAYGQTSEPSVELVIAAGHCMGPRGRVGRNDRHVRVGARKRRDHDQHDDRWFSVADLDAQVDPRGLDRRMDRPSHR